MTKRIRARAKVNLLLNVLGREDSGFHALETIFLALDLADEVTVSSGEPGIAIMVSGDPSVPADSTNLCWRATEAFAVAAGQSASVGIELNKLIPAGAGLGGGSSDAAAVLVALNEAHGQPLDMAGLAAIGGKLGSDVPFFLSGAAMALGWERGRRLLPLPGPEPRPVLIVVPPFGISAAEAYGWLAACRASSAHHPGGTVLPDPPRLSDWSELARLAANDFEPIVFGRKPELQRVRDSLLSAGATISMLCGSGSCVFGVFADSGVRDTAARALPIAAGYRLIATSTAS